MLPICRTLSKVSPVNRKATSLLLLPLLLALGSCASERPPSISEPDARALIRRALPDTVADKPGWANDIYTGFTSQGLEPNHENICAVVAVIEQESTFHSNPVVPG